MHVTPGRARAQGLGKKSGFLQTGPQDMARGAPSPSTGAGSTEGLGSRHPSRAGCPPCQAHELGAEVERAMRDAWFHSELAVGVWEALQAQWSEKGCLVPRNFPSNLTLLFCAQVGKEEVGL